MKMMGLYAWLQYLAGAVDDGVYIVVRIDCKFQSCYLVICMSIFVCRSVSLSMLCVAYHQYLIVYVALLLTKYVRAARMIDNRK